VVDIVSVMWIATPVYKELVVKTVLPLATLLLVTQGAF
jgi:hypothetical protein